MRFAVLPELQKKQGIDKEFCSLLRRVAKVHVVDRVTDFDGAEFGSDFRFQRHGGIAGYSDCVVGSFQLGLGQGVLALEFELICSHDDLISGFAIHGYQQSNIVDSSAECSIERACEFASGETAGVSGLRGDLAHVGGVHRLFRLYVRTLTRFQMLYF